MSVTHGVIMLSAKGLEKRFGPTHALRGAELEVQFGELLAVMGRSGSGKSTLLHCLAGIITPDKGEVEFSGRRIDKLSDDERTALRRTSFGFVFQFGQLVPELTALDNVALPLLLNRAPRQAAYQQAAEWLARVDLRASTDKLPGELSGGEAQRVAVARAMVIQPKVLFADEPTGSLDSLNSELVMELIVEMVRQQGTTVVMVTHEPTIAAYADREVIVRDGVVTEAV